MINNYLMYNTCIMLFFTDLELNKFLLDFSIFKFLIHFYFIILCLVLHFFHNLSINRVVRFYSFFNLAISLQSAITHNKKTICLLLFFFQDNIFMFLKQSFFFMNKLFELIIITTKFTYATLSYRINAY